MRPRSRAVSSDAIRGSGASQESPAYTARDSLRLALLSWASVLAAASPSSGSIPSRLDAALAGHAAGAERAAWASSLLLGAPYRLSPLGEGSGVDPDPRFRLDAFDCVTLVETAIALGNARTVAEAERLLDDVRYDGAPSYGRRNHYVESQWLPSLERKGWLRPVTRELAGSAATRIVKHLDDATWELSARAGHVVRGLSFPDLPRGDFALDVVALPDLVEIAGAIPNGTVALVVREDREHRPTRVTHMGIVVVRPDGTRAFRHASDVPGSSQVRDEAMEAFVRRAARWHWKVVGVSLYGMPDNSARARELLEKESGPEGLRGSGK